MNMNACDGLALPLWKSMLTSRNWVDTNGVPSVCRDYFVKCFQQCEQARAAKLERWHKLKRIVADLDGVRKAHHGLEVEMNSRCKCWQFRIQFLQKNWDSNASNVNSPDTLAWAQSILHPSQPLKTLFQCNSHWSPFQRRQVLSGFLYTSVPSQNASFRPWSSSRQVIRAQRVQTFEDWITRAWNVFMHIHVVPCIENRRLELKSRRWGAKMCKL